MRTLFAAVQLGVAFRTVAVEIGSGRQGGGTVETTRRRHVLYQPRQARSSDVNGRSRPLWFRTILARASRVAVRVHVPGRSVLAIAVHGKNTPYLSGRKKSFSKIR